MNAIHHKSCERMEELADGDVALTVTSPPYWNAIDYSAHCQGGPDADYRPRQQVDYAEYLGFLGRCFAETGRVTRPGGFCAVVVGTVLRDGEHVPLPFHLVGLMEGLGWRFHQDIVWYKCTGGVKRAGSTIRNPYPGYYYPNLMCEYILVFRRPGPRIYEGRSPADKEASRYEVDSVFTRDVANDIWHIAPVPPGQYPHPCPFPEEIPYRLISLYSYRGDLVLDPFAGIGTTLKVARQLGRRWVGYEVMEDYVREAEARVQTPLHLREQLVCTFDKVAPGERIPAKNPKRRPFVRRKRGQ